MGIFLQGEWGGGWVLGREIVVQALSGVGPPGVSHSTHTAPGLWPSAPHAPRRTELDPIMHLHGLSTRSLGQGESSVISSG